MSRLHGLVMIASGRLIRVVTVADEIGGNVVPRLTDRSPAMDKDRRIEELILHREEESDRGMSEQRRPVLVVGVDPLQVFTEDLLCNAKEDHREDRTLEFWLVPPGGHGVHVKVEVCTPASQLGRIIGDIEDDLSVAADADDALDADELEFVKGFKRPPSATPLALDTLKARMDNILRHFASICKILLPFSLCKDVPRIIRHLARRKGMYPTGKQKEWISGDIVAAV